MAAEMPHAYAKLPAQDVERARAFYARTLGVEPCGEHNGHLHYRLDGCYLVVFPSSGAPSGTHDQLGLVVDDLATAVADLRDRGVAFEGPIADFGEVKAAWFKDSEGNLISLAEFASGSPFKRAG